MECGNNNGSKEWNESGSQGNESNNSGESKQLYLFVEMKMALVFVAALLFLWDFLVAGEYYCVDWT